MNNLNSENVPKPVAFIYAPGQAFLAPYFERELAKYDVIFCPEALPEVPTAAEAAVMISSTGIYDVKQGENFDESTEVDPNSEWVAHEAAFRVFCTNNSLTCTILRASNIVGTGMNGFAMRIARGIARGTLMHIIGNQARISLVHAVDIPAVARRVWQSGLIVNVTDGCATPLDELVSALAYRINDKKVFDIKPRWARLLYGRQFYSELTTTLTFSNVRCERLTDGMPMHPVCEYLKTHVYDDESL